MEFQTIKTFISCNIFKIIIIICGTIAGILDLLREFLSEKYQFIKNNDIKIFWTIICLLVIIAILQVIQLFRDRSASVKMEALEEDNKRLSLENNQISLFKYNISWILKAYLREIAQILQISPQERISLYIILESQFALCGRVSNNPDFEKTGRGGYPLNEGVIGLAWQNQTHFENSIPQFSKKSNKYQRYQETKYNIPCNISQKFIMKSLMYYGYRLQEHDNSEPVGVIIIESLNPNKYQEEVLKSTLDGVEPFLYKIIKTFKEYIPAIIRAEQEDGF